MFRRAWASEMSVCAHAGCKVGSFEADKDAKRPFVHTVDAKSDVSKQIRARNFRLCTQRMHLRMFQPVNLTPCPFCGCRTSHRGAAARRCAFRRAEKGHRVRFGAALYTSRAKKGSRCALYLTPWAFSGVRTSHRRREVRTVGVFKPVNLTRWPLSAARTSQRGRLDPRRALRKSEMATLCLVNMGEGASLKSFAYECSKRGILGAILGKNRFGTVLEPLGTPPLIRQNREKCAIGAIYAQAGCDMAKEPSLQAA